MCNLLVSALCRKEVAIEFFHMQRAAQETYTDSWSSPVAEYSDPQQK